MNDIKKLIMVILLTAATTASAGELKVPDGFRATVISALPIEAKHLKPGDRVDMLVTIPPSDTNPSRLTATLLQNVLVLAASHKTGDSSVILALNPQEAQYALLAQFEKYRVNFIIRGKGDTKSHTMEVATLKRLFNDEPEKDASESENNSPESEENTDKTGVLISPN